MSSFKPVFGRTFRRAREAGKTPFFFVSFTSHSGNANRRFDSSLTTWEWKRVRRLVERWANSEEWPLLNYSKPNGHWAPGTERRRYSIQRERFIFLPLSAFFIRRVNTVDVDIMATASRIICVRIVSVNWAWGLGASLLGQREISACAEPLKREKIVETVEVIDDLRSDGMRATSSSANSPFALRPLTRRSYSPGPIDS